MNEQLQISDKAREAAKACELAAVNHDQGLLTYNQYAELVETKIQIAINEETKPLWEMLERFSYRLKQNRPIVLTDGSHEDFEDCAIQDLLTDYHQLLKSKGKTK